MNFENNCLYYMISGICPNGIKICNLNHLKPKVMKKKAFKKNSNLFVPNIKNEVIEEDINEYNFEEKICNCCYGDPMNCKNTQVCDDMGVCECYLNNYSNNVSFDEADDLEGEMYYEEFSDCRCCRGYINSCKCPDVCQCFN